jgi:hypothetical protein
LETSPRRYPDRLRKAGHGDGVDITGRLTINDLLNVAMQLRTVPELITYLDFRRDLPDVAQRRVGEEMVLLEYRASRTLAKAV